MRASSVALGVDDPRIVDAAAECAKAVAGKVGIRGYGVILEALRRNDEAAIRAALIAASDKVTREVWNNFVQIPNCAALVIDLNIRPGQAGGGAAPVAPSNLTVRPDPSNPNVMLLSWTDNSPNDKGFQVSNGKDYRHAPKNPGTGTVTYTWTGLQPNSWTCFRVRADNGDTFSAWEPGGSPYYRCAYTSRPPASDKTSGTSVLASAFVGTWTGSVTQDGSALSPYALRVSITGGQVGGTVATGDYPTLKCRVHWTLKQVKSAGEVIVRETVDQGAGCVDVDVTLALSGDSKMRYTFRDGLGRAILQRE